MNRYSFPVSFGCILITWNASEHLSQIQWSENRLAVWQRTRVPRLLLPTIDRLRAYFYSGEPIGDVPWDLIEKSDWTDFQAKVYEAIVPIPHGETRTYGWVASRLGKPVASRAVGQALKRNPLPILVPCHRVVKTNSLGGFMGTTDPNQPELQLKRHLTQLEEEYRSPHFSFLGSVASASQMAGYT